jgi:adenylate cyclase
VIERILEDPDQLRLGGERRELTILFSDLAGFTSLSEGLDPQELTHLLNDYLSEMSEFILAAGGTLDKYEGDAIIAFWNAPLSQPDHALAACRAALKCNQRLLQRAPEYEKRLGRALWARIGINTGPVVVGNMGSRQRFDYTVLGDAANLASRLEGANKVFGTPLMVSEDTWKQTRGELRGRKLGRLKVVGRRESVVVYQPLAKADRKVSHEMEVFAQGLDLVEKRKWQAALSCFKTIETDPAAKAYIHKLSQLASESPDAWDGVWNLTNK